VHVRREGEPVDHLAARYLGEATLWWRIEERNDMMLPMHSPRSTRSRSGTGTADAMAFFSRHVPIIPPPDLDRRRIRATGAGRADQRIRTRSLEPQVSPESRVLEPDRTLLADEEQVLARG
jgi:hypothetical protein